MHIFGHTHLTVDLVVEGQRYVQWALGTQREQQAMTRAVGDTGMLVLHRGARDLALVIKKRYDSASEPPVAPVQDRPKSHELPWASRPRGDVLGSLLPCGQEGPKPDVPRTLRSEVLLADVQRLGASRLNLGYSNYH